MTSEREKIAARIRALRAKTVENGCTEDEAIAAAEMLARLLEKYNLTLEEAELRASPFEKHTETYHDWVGERLWKVAAAVSYLTGARYWRSRYGVYPVEISFFGFVHEVEVSRYMLEICTGAMRREMQRRTNPLLSFRKQRAQAGPFLDGMADSLWRRIRALKPKQPIGTGLIVLHDALVEQAMKDAGHDIEDMRSRGSLTLEAGYLDGLAAGDRVSLNQGLGGGRASVGLLG